MKENMFDVLMYLFENYLDDEAAVITDHESVKVELQEAGFTNADITKAFDWLDCIAQHPETSLRYRTAQPQSIRLYSALEQKRLDVSCRGFLLFLEQVGILDTTNRELIIDRAMALDMEEFDLDRLKWVVLMVLSNQPGQEARLTWMEDFILENLPQQLH